MNDTTLDAIKASQLRQSHGATSLKNYVIFAPCVRWINAFIQPANPLFAQLFVQGQSIDNVNVWNGTYCPGAR